VRVVGLTGGIGSGKSSLAALLAERGVPVIDADLIARDCVAPGTEGLRAVVERFGDGVLDPTGALDRAAMAAIVFRDDVARRELEAIVHPCIRAGIATALDVLRSGPTEPDLVVVEHPLLIETGAHARVDVVVVVEAPHDTRVERLVATRGMTEDEVRARIASQADDAGRRTHADHVITNVGDLGDLAREADRLLALLRPGGRPGDGVGTDGP
jgi:dephospho-CoA kinase